MSSRSSPDLDDLHLPWSDRAVLRSGSPSWHIPALGFGVLATIVASAWAYGPRRMEAHERALLDEARAILATPVPATLHAPTQGTTFAAAAIPALDRIAQLSKAHPRSAADDEAAGRVRSGTAAASTLPAAWNLLLDEGSGAIDGLLHATRAPSMGDWPGLWAEPSYGGRGHQYTRAIHLGARLSALRIRRRIEAHDAGSALDDCADLFALARDAAVRGGFVGHAVGESIAGFSLVPCAAAIDLSPVGSADQMESASTACVPSCLRSSRPFARNTSRTASAHTGGRCPRTV
jgi:hypothetical protein